MGTGYDHERLGEALRPDSNNEWRTVIVRKWGVTHKQAVEKVTGEYKKYKERTLIDVEQDYLNSIKILEKKTDKG